MHTLYIFPEKGNCIGLEYHIILSKIHIIVIIKTKIIDKNKSCSNTFHQHLEVRYHLMVIKKLHHLLEDISDEEKISKGLFPHQTSHQHLEVRYHLMVIKKLQRLVSSSNFLPALGGKIPFDGNKETSKVCFLIKLLTSTWR